MASTWLARGSRYTPSCKSPPPAEVKAAGGMLEDGRVAVDIGLLRFDADLTAALTELAGFKSCRRSIFTIRSRAG